jgi:hypothetical protein
MVQCAAYIADARYAVLVGRGDLAIYDRFTARQLDQRFCDRPHGAGIVAAVACREAHVTSGNARHDPPAIYLDLVHPTRGRAKLKAGVGMQRAARELGVGVSTVVRVKAENDKEAR